MENEKKNNEMLVGILIGVIIMLLVGLCLFATGIVGFKSNTATDTEKTTENNETTSDTNTIQTKLVDNIECNNSETTFNGITVKVEHKKDSASNVCQLSSFTINGQDASKMVSAWIDSYEIYDNNVIISSGDTSGRLFTIYSLSKNDAVVKLEPSNLDGYWVTSYSTNGNKITLTAKECGDQCGTGTTGYPNATYEIEYSNGIFSAPALVDKSK